jgi:hypothetical protein
MPIKPFDPSKLSVYPDHSTLCDAFKSNTSDGGGVSPAFRPLKGWIERVAHEASLCLSVGDREIPPARTLGQLGPEGVAPRRPRSAPPSGPCSLGAHAPASGHLPSVTFMLRS